MNIYTKTGDSGTTALFGGTRIPKHDLRIDCYGTIDELNSHMGLLRDQKIAASHQSVLIRIQQQLFTIGAILATDPEKATLANGTPRLTIPSITIEEIQQLERAIDTMETALPPLRSFILPGGHQTVSFCHIARCVCRRAERLATALHEISPFDAPLLPYLNRLSDYLFVLARKLTYEVQAEEIPWVPKKS